MRVLLKVDFSNDAFREVLEEGRLQELSERLLGELEPEAVYMSVDGSRTNWVVVDIERESELVEVVEPFFLSFDADVEATPVMTPAVLEEVDPEELFRTWG